MYAILLQHVYLVFSFLTVCTVSVDCRLHVGVEFYLWVLSLCRRHPCVHLCHLVTPSVFCHFFMTLSMISADCHLIRFVASCVLGGLAAPAIFCNYFVTVRTVSGYRCLKAVAPIGLWLLTLNFSVYTLPLQVWVPGVLGLSSMVFGTHLSPSFVQLREWSSS